MAAEENVTSSVLRRNAEMAIYMAKEAGRNTLRFYDYSMNINRFERPELVSGLRHAIGADQLRLYFQPKHQVRGEKLVAAEALIRWFQLDDTTIMPTKLILVAEAGGLFVAVGEWVLNELRVQYEKWYGAGHVSLSVAVNLSFIHFSMSL